MNHMNTYTIEFVGATDAEANRYAAELKEMLTDASPDLNAEVHRKSPNTMDFGSTVVLVLGTPAVIIAANAIRDWLKRRNSVSIDITDSSGRKKITGVNSKDAEKIIRIFQQ